MPLTPELRQKIISLYQSGKGRNQIERELIGQISRTSISAVIRAYREESSAVECGRKAESCLVSNPNPQTEDTGNNQGLNIVKDNNSDGNDRPASKEDWGYDDYQNLHFPNVMYQVESKSKSEPEPLPIPPLTAIQVQTQQQRL